jgi:hypothetical protein
MPLPSAVSLQSNRSRTSPDRQDLERLPRAGCDAHAVGGAGDTPDTVDLEELVTPATGLLFVLVLQLR